MKPMFILFSLVLAASAQAQVVTIDQAKALAGNVTPGDAPGFPVTISRPGSYILSGRLDVPPDTSGIEITSDDVTLNLNGFAVRGPVVCTPSGLTINCNAAGELNGDGVIASSGARRTHLFGGRVVGFARRGVVLGSGSIVERLFIGDINFAGAVIAGGSRLVDSSIGRVRSTGLLLGGGAVDRVSLFSIGGRGIEAFGTGGSSITNTRFADMQRGIHAVDAIGRLLVGGNTFDLSPGEAISGGHVTGSPNACNHQAC